MSVAVCDDVAAGKPGEEPLAAAGVRPRIVDETDPKALGLDDATRRQDRLNLRVVDIPVHGFEPAVRLELDEGRERREVARVQHEVGPREHVEAGVREAPRPAREMRVSEERDQKAPSRNAPSR